MLFVSEFVRCRCVKVYDSYLVSPERFAADKVPCAVCGNRVALGDAVRTEVWDGSDFVACVCCDKCGLPLRWLEQLRFSPSIEDAHPPIPDDIAGLQG